MVTACWRLISGPEMMFWEAEDPYQPWSIHFYEKDVYFMDMGGNMRCYQWDEEYLSPSAKDPNMAWIRPE